MSSCMELHVNCWDINTSCRNSTASFFTPDVVNNDILTQVLKPPEKVHME